MRSIDRSTRCQLSTRYGRPLVRLSGGARLVADRLGVGEVLISVSHCRTHAVAYATAIGK